MSTHQPSCPAVRTEAFVTDVDGGRQVHTTRCLDCGAQQVRTNQTTPLPVDWGTDGWRWAWRNDPISIARTLTVDQRADPLMNPLHPQAPSWPPDKPPAIPHVTDGKLGAFPVGFDHRGNITYDARDPIPGMHLPAVVTGLNRLRGAYVTSRPRR